MTSTRNALLTLAALFVSTTGAQASISVALLGSAAPPPTILGVPMTAAIPDPSPLFSDLLSVPLTADKSVLFSTPVSHRRIGAGWATWSHGYTGDVYYSNSPTTITMTFSQPDITGFRFYIEAETFGPFTATIQANGSGGVSTMTTQLGDGSGGAVGFGVISTGSTKLTSVSVSVSIGFSVGYAVGEFGWAKSIPSPGALAMLGMAGLFTRRRQR